MAKRPDIPVALTIAGSDSGGGAGIQADMSTFAALGVHGTSAITCITAQNPREVRTVQPCRPETVRSQIEAVCDAFQPAAVKTGMLYSTSILRAVVEACRDGVCRPPIVDPVMISTSGAGLLNPSAAQALREELLPLCLLVTPNVPEAEVLVGHPIRSVEQLRAASREINARYGCAALIKGGHLRGLRVAVDFFHDGRTELMLSAPFVRGVHTHGTGCTYSAAVTAFIARGFALPAAIQRAKEFISQAIAHSHRAAGHSVLNWFYRS